ncbi:unnamed protein product, partial [Nesidiocoris tenuis]
MFKIRSNNDELVIEIKTALRPRFSNSARAARGMQGSAESSTFLESWKKTAGKRIAYAKVTSFEDYLDTVIIIGLPIIGHKL